MEEKAEARLAARQSWPASKPASELARAHTQHEEDSIPHDEGMAVCRRAACLWREPSARRGATSKNVEPVSNNSMHRYYYLDTVSAGHLRSTLLQILPICKLSWAKKGSLCNNPSKIASPV